ncbi:IQ domain-containing protein [Striga asiatica]|uniref:IQ domain-containing protein n=1 Tax=Striga asiatica TaxID=4170 RepID=A0A5A7RII7_STRAF|nr:IQ domain-containing protein [Striga asiatica]
MGKSSASCFKIITCAGESQDYEDLQAPENKGSSDRRRWSFRKRSARHRVLSNTVGSEAPSSVNKENPDSPAVKFSEQADFTAAEKPSVIHLTEEKAELPTQLDSKLSETQSEVEDDCKKDTTFDEPSIIIIQAAIRRLLSQQVLLKQKNIIKLQAAVRGHIVRRHAVGTLRCVQAIIKMQALVRARHAGRLDNNDPTILGKKEDHPNTRYTYVSIEKLLSNAFARQLMESTPRNKPINIKCDPSKSDSAWKWLERWMSASSVSSTGSPESESTVENLELPDGQVDIVTASDCSAELKDLNSTLGASAVSSETHLISRDLTNLHSARSMSPASGLSNLHEVDQLNSTTDGTESALIEMKEKDFIEVVEVKSLPQKDENTLEQIEAEAKKLSRKASKPAFVAAHSKFEALTSAKLAPSSTQDLDETGLDKDRFSLSTDQTPKSTGNKVPDNAAVSAATSALPIGSECGTELSISSTLDSPDRSEAGANEIEQEMKASDDTKHFKTDKNTEIEADGKTPTAPETNSFTDTNVSKIYVSVDSAAVESLDSINAEDSPSVEKMQEAKLADVQLEVESDASPRSHLTVPESQVSVKPKKRKGEKSDSSSRKNRSSSSDKNRSKESVSRTGLEQLQEPKAAGKRRNSFGSGSKPDHKEQEPRDSSSSNSLPSYMQVTESAKAKAIANGSPRSSPDVHDKDIYIKKRHSLPGANERQGSPRIQRSLSQAQQNTKGTATMHSPQGIISAVNYQLLKIVVYSDQQLKFLSCAMLLLYNIFNAVRALFLSLLSLIFVFRQEMAAVSMKLFETNRVVLDRRIQVFWATASVFFFCEEAIGIVRIVVVRGRDVGIWMNFLCNSAVLMFFYVGLVEFFGQNELKCSCVDLCLYAILRIGDEPRHKRFLSPDNMAVADEHGRILFVVHQSPRNINKRLMGRTIEDRHWTRGFKFDGLET